MAFFHYGTPPHSYEFDDRTLTHLRIVLTAKMRRNEDFLMSWREGDQEKSVWISHTVPMVFEFDQLSSTDVNRDWIALLVQTANSAGGLIITPEPPAKPASR
ncbi:hypothetical protein [Jonesia quinghaiensis]|uniref:DUF7882 family protein n=1 Tax=Jonesia quinghaiensis TaxID=262806 RepID=UPI00042448F3|nr:hypothetical protein [Jonesia quinghaiensis]